MLWADGTTRSHGVLPLLGAPFAHPPLGRMASLRVHAWEGKHHWFIVIPKTCLGLVLVSIFRTHGEQVSLTITR